MTKASRAFGTISAAGWPNKPFRAGCANYLRFAFAFRY